MGAWGREGLGAWQTPDFPHAPTPTGPLPLPAHTVTEAGLFFIAYTEDLAIPKRMLGRMMGTAGDGLHDHLMDFTQAVSGATFFAPSLTVLKSLAAR